MPKRIHPARRARMAATVVGTGGFVIMVGTIAEGSVTEVRVDLSALAPDRSTQPTIDLRGGATPPTVGPSTPTSTGNPASTAVTSPTGDTSTSGPSTTSTTPTTEAADDDTASSGS